MAPRGSTAGGTNQPTYDQALKWMLRQAPQAVVDLLQPGLRWQSERSPELPAVARQADLVWEVASASGERGLLHVELQTKSDPAMGERLLEYGVRLWLRDHLPVRSVVVYLKPARRVPDSPFVLRFLGHETLRYRYHVVRLWQVPQEHVLGSPSYVLWPLAGAMKGATPETTAAVAERLAEVAAPRRERSDLIALLASLTGLQEAMTDVLAALRRNHVIDELFRESGLADILIEEGKAEGKAEGARQMAQTALEGRFGPLSEDVVAALQRADVPTLQELVAHLTTVTLEQVRARLGL